MEMFLIPRERGHNADGLWGHRTGFDTCQFVLAVDLSYLF